MRIMLVCALALAVGCGGGGGTTMATAQLAGIVYEVDGETLDLAGVQVTLKETGEWAWTDAAGSFEFGGLEAGTYTLDFMGDGEGAPGGDEFADGAGDPKVDVPEGGRVEIRVAIEGGEVKDYSSDCEKDQSAIAKLGLTEDAAAEGFDVAGAIKIAERDGGTLIKVCVEGLDGGAVIEVFVGETSIGTATADGDGRACLVLENDLPLDATDLSELAGLGVGVTLSETGFTLLVGEVPDLAADDGDGKPDGGDGVKAGEDGCEGECDKDGDTPDGSDGEGEAQGSDGEDGQWGNDDGTEDKDEGDCEEGEDGDGTDGGGGTEGGDSGTEAT